jgi:hypothetical protein
MRFYLIATEQAIEEMEQKRRGVCRERQQTKSGFGYQ